MRDCCKKKCNKLPSRPSGWRNQPDSRMCRAWNKFPSLVFSHLGLHNVSTLLIAEIVILDESSLFHRSSPSVPCKQHFLCWCKIHSNLISAFLHTTPQAETKNSFSCRQKASFFHAFQRIHFSPPRWTQFSLLLTLKSQNKIEPVPSL